MLVAGIVGMLGILNSNMANTSMRFMAHSLGSGDKEITLKTFNTTLFLHFVIGAIVVFLMEIGGWLMFKYLLNIPPEKMFDAKVVFHFMVITTFISVISVPYDAVMNSHEDIIALSLANIFGYILKLGVAIYLTFSHANLLILYGFLMLVVQLLLRIIKQFYCRARYDECKIRFRSFIDKKLMRSILSFTGWNLLNSVSELVLLQLKGVFLNAYYGVSINAAEGVARQATTQVNMVSISMTQAINPQVMKSEGGGDRQRMLYLTGLGTKFSAFLFTLIAIPLFFEAPYLLNLWLKSVPNYTIIFFQIILIASAFEKFTFEITTAIRAVGNIKNFQIIETGILMLNIPIYYFVLKMGYPPYTVFITSILVSLIGAYVRLYFGKKIAGMNISIFFKESVFPVMFSIVLSCLIALAPKMLLPESLIRFFLTLLLTTSTMVYTFWNWGLNNSEKTKLKHALLTIKQKILKNRNNGI